MGTTKRGPPSPRLARTRKLSFEDVAPLDEALVGLFGACLSAVFFG